MELIQKESLVAAAAARLRDAILSGELQPGEVVRVQGLQERLGISHIPIREAIRQLEADGLIVAPSRRPPFVAHVSSADLAAIYELRRLIELPTARLARQLATETDVRSVREAYAAFEGVAMEPHLPEYWQRHNGFHWALLEVGANIWTRRVLDPLWAGAERYVRLFVLNYVTPMDTLGLHRALMEAYDSGDAQLLADVLDQHFAETERVVRDGLEAQETSAAI